jgi:diguanylate cyclase (GGDEF)-like protein
MFLRDFDVLTGLRTRALLEQEAGEALADPSSVLALVDIDHFKRINDQHGHLRGDAVLRAVAQRIMNVLIALPESTRAYRYGGEEFVVLGPLTATILEQLRSAVADSDCDGLPVTISVGAARAHESNAGRRGLADVFSIADERLYRAKAEGRNRVVF